MNTDNIREKLERFLGTAYSIERELGGGGMSRVFVATETALQRQVVIKALSTETSDVAAADRFAREVITSARLQHPNIVPVLSAGNADGVPFYTMPFVKGSSLRHHLDQKSKLPLHEAVAILRDVLRAMSHAHSEGIVHRDIKPGNILLSGNAALVADFGIAKAVAAAFDTGNDRASTTLTQGGIALGTPAYMAPEQSAGERVDGRADIYAWGIIAYEILSGNHPFARKTTQREMITAHFTENPRALSEIRKDIPQRLESAVMRAIAKDPDARWQHANELLPELESVDSPASSHGARIFWIGAAAAVVLAAVVLTTLLMQREPAPGTYEVGKVTALTTAEGLELDPALSPDGKTLAYVSGTPGSTRIYLRQIDGARVIPLTDDSVAPNQRWPQWSPDGTRIAFHAGAGEALYRSTGIRRGGTIYTVPALGGNPRHVVDRAAGADAFSPSWSPDGTRLAFTRTDTLYSIPADGGTPTFLATDDGAAGPRWSPDGRKIVYTAGNPRFVFGTTHLANAAPSSIRIVDVVTKARTVLVPDSSLNVSPVWTPDGRSILFISERGGRRDIYRIAVNASGEHDGVAERMTAGIDAHTMDLSRDGTRLVYSAYSPAAHLWSVPIPGDSTIEAYSGKQLTRNREAIEGITLSPDGKWLAFDSNRSGNFDIWKIPAAGGGAVELTTDPAGDHVQSWSPAGDELVFHSFRTGNRDVFVMRADGSGVSRVTYSRGSDSNPAWCGSSSVVVQSSERENEELLQLWTRDAVSARWSMRRQLASPQATDPACSRDGQWLAYLWNGGVQVMSLTTFQSRNLVPARNGRPAPAMPGFGSDPNTVYYMAYDDRRVGSIWSIPIEGGEPRKLVRFDDPARPSLRRDFATDGRILYFAIAQPQSDIYLMELKTPLH